MMSTATGTCPSLEEIAAFLDGRLAGEDRTRIVAHLADCPSCFEVFAETAQFQFDEGEEEAEAPDPPEAVASPETAVVVPFPRKKVLPWVAAVAAAVLLIGLAAALFYRSATTMPEMVSAELVTPKLASAAGNSLWPKGIFRGGSPTVPETTPAEFMIGAYLVDLRIALLNNNRPSSLDVLSSILRLIDALYFSGPQEKLVESIHSRIDKGQKPRTLLGESEKMEADLTKISSSALLFGEWTEAGRLSAIAGQPELFEDRDNRKLLRWLLQNKEKEDVALDPEVVQALEQIEESLKSDPGKLPYDDLHKQLESILDHYQAAV